MAMPGSGEQNPFTVGTRIECNGENASIMYVGEVPPAKGLWLGVEWDNAGRGKHDGTYEGVRYFQTRDSTSGSFVRIAKAHLGISCTEAIKQRYGKVEDDDTAGINKENLASCQKSIKAPFFEVVGFDKVNRLQSQFQNMRVVCLRQERVNNAGLPGELLNLAPKIREMDLSKNLLKSWQEISEITVQLKHLMFLQVSENRLSIPKTPETLKEAFRSLERLVLSTMDYNWQEILRISIMWPYLQMLQVPFNYITTLQVPPHGVLSKLTYLDLEGNCINNWEEINKLGSLSLLRNLNLSNVGVRDIWFPDSETPGKTDLFPQLKILVLVRNNIKEWTSVCQLDKLRELQELRFHQNPVLDTEDMETCRQIMIASVGAIQVLNGVTVPDQERKGAEYDYLKKHGKEWLAVNKCDSNAMQEFVALYPRYRFLVEKYGAPEEGEMRVQSNLIVDNLISVEIFCPNDLSTSRVKKLLPTMTVQKLSGYAQRLFDTGNTIPSLSYISSKNPDIEVPFENDLKQLNFYSIESGDRISVRW